MITISVDVFCDLCGGWTHGGVNCSYRKARLVAKSQGFTRRYLNETGRYGYRDLCPDCEKRIQEDSKPSPTGDKTDEWRATKARGAD